MNTERNTRHSIWPKSVLDVSIYMQQMTSADNIFRCIFFVAGEGLIILSNDNKMQF